MSTPTTSLTAIGSKRRPLGRLRYETSEDPPAFVVRGAGAIGPALVRDDLARAQTFGAAHPAGWCYVADARWVVWPSPRIVRYVRRIRRLPNVRGYLLVARLPVRLAVRPLRLVGGPHKAFRSLDRALVDAARRTGRPEPGGRRRRIRRSRARDGRAS
ncbi:MAG: hypothetical protein ACRD0U_11870 [Acidimicrobiales bacterium]